MALPKAVDSASVGSKGVSSVALDRAYREALSPPVSARGATGAAYRSSTEHRCRRQRKLFGRGPVPAGGADSVGAHHVHVWTRPVQDRRPVSRQGAVCPLWFIACGGPGSPVACRPGSSDELERALPAVHRGIPVPPQAVTSSSRSRCPGASASGACRWQSTRGARLWTAAGERGSLPLQA